MTKLVTPAPITTIVTAEPSTVTQPVPTTVHATETATVTSTQLVPTTVRTLTTQQIPTTFRETKTVIATAGPATVTSTVTPAPVTTTVTNEPVAQSGSQTVSGWIQGFVGRERPGLEETRAPLGKGRDSASR